MVIEMFNYNKGIKNMNDLSEGYMIKEDHLYAIVDILKIKQFICDFLELNHNKEFTRNLSYGLKTYRLTGLNKAMLDAFFSMNRDILIHDGTVSFSLSTNQDHFKISNNELYFYSGYYVKKYRKLLEKYHIRKVNQLNYKPQYISSYCSKDGNSIIDIIETLKMIGMKEI